MRGRGEQVGIRLGHRGLGRVKNLGKGYPRGREPFQLRNEAKSFVADQPARGAERPRLPNEANFSAPGQASARSLKRRNYETKPNYVSIFSHLACETRAKCPTKAMSALTSPRSGPSWAGVPREARARWRDRPHPCADRQAAWRLGAEKHLVSPTPRQVAVSCRHRPPLHNAHATPTHAPLRHLGRRTNPGRRT